MGTKGGRDDEMGIGLKPGWANRTLRGLVFWAGDCRFIHHFPWFTWDVTQHKIDLNEVIKEALPLLEPGDIILHRDGGFLSNRLIGGTMVHAGLYVGDGQVVEAISEGVVMRHAAHILHSDYACILRPNLGSIKESKIAAAKAVEFALKVVGMPYDYLFMFNYKEEIRKITELGATEAARQGVKICCTELPSLCYYDYLAELRFCRRRNINFITRFLSWFGLNPGELVIAADQYVTAQLDIIWLSKEFTTEWAKKRKCSEEYVHKIEAAWQQYWIYNGGPIDNS